MQSRRARHAAPSRTRRGFTRTRLVSVIAILVTLVVMAAIVTLAAFLAYRHAPSPRPSVRPPTQTLITPPSSATTSPPPQAVPNDQAASLAAEFTQLENSLHAKMGVAVSAVGNGQAPVTWGDWQDGPAWSTIKVPLVIAAYRQQNPEQVTDLMKAAITESDNAAAESLWAQLGDPATAARRVQQILQETGDPTTVESRKLRPEFTAFGQTTWSLDNQIRFTATAFCNGANDPIFDLMGQVKPDQRWGIGSIRDTEFKGGWGPSRSGKYLVRQIGVLTTPTGKIAVAIAAEPESGSFDDGTRDLGEVAKWLTGHLGALPAGQCGG
jgi:Beta-lactamase enzyme family